MKALRSYLLFLLLGGLLSCHKKDYPQPEQVVNSAVYYSKLTINNQPIVLQAGVDGYYMYASYKLDSSFVYTYVADLKKSDCTNCTNSLKVAINDYKSSLSAIPSAIDSALRVDYYNFESGNPQASYAVPFYSIPDNTFSYSWDFGDGSNSHEANPVHTFARPGTYNVCLTTVSNTGYVNSICNKVRVDGSNTFCKTSISALATSGYNINFSSTTSGGKAPYQYLWSFGDGITSTQSAPTHTYRYLGSYGVTLRVVDALGDTAYCNYNAKTMGDNSSAANYNVAAVQALLPQPAFSQIVINWTDANGQVYTSNNSLQPYNSTFQILSVSDNDKNELGQPTKKIKAKFNCMLYNGRNAITVNNAEVVLCVAYK